MIFIMFSALQILDATRLAERVPALFSPEFVTCYA